MIHYLTFELHDFIPETISFHIQIHFIIITIYLISTEAQLVFLVPRASEHHGDCSLNRNWKLKKKSNLFNSLAFGSVL